MDLFSKKYNKWYRCLEVNRHPRHLHIFKFGDFYWRSDKDLLIHKTNIEEYIDVLNKRRAKIRQEAYCKKNGIEIK